jgi:predicted Zn finger-like uncharacterized protein
MKLACSHCQHQINIEDSKVPSGVFKVKCPKCGKIVTGQKEAAGDRTGPISAGSVASAADELQAAYDTQSTGQSVSTQEPDNGHSLTPEVQGYVKKEILHLRKEILGSLSSLFGPGRHFHPDQPPSEDDEDDFDKKALICEDDGAFVDIISTALKRLGYKVDTAGTTADSLKKIETGHYNLVTIDYNFPDDKEGGVKILSKLNGQKPNIRRETFVVLISANVKSADASAAFFLGANITVNKEEIRHLEHLIRDGQRRFHELYRIFNRMVEEKNEKI